MKKILLTMLLLTSCTVTNSPDEANKDINPVEPGALPYFEMSINDVPVEGIEGSYCGKTMCVDKIPPFDQDLDYAESTYQDGDTLIVKVKGPEKFQTLKFSLMDSKGSLLDEDLMVEPQSEEGVYKIIDELNGDEVLLLAFGQFENGDMSYFFPFTIED